MRFLSKCKYFILIFLVVTSGFAYSSDKGFKINSMSSTYTKDGGVQVLTSIIIHYPIEMVYRVMNDFEHYGEFMPSFDKTRVERKKEITTVAVDHDMPILGNFPCFFEIREKKEGDKIHIEYKTTICFFDRNEGYYTIKSINGGKETEIIFFTYLKKNSIFVPKFIIKFLIKYVQKDVLNAFVKRIRKEK